MELDLVVGDFKDHKYYEEVRASDEFFSPNTLSQNVIITENSLLVNITGAVSVLPLKKQSEFIFGEHLINFCELDFYEIAKTLETPNFDFDDKESLCKLLIKDFGNSTGVFRFLPTLGTDYKTSFTRYFEYLIDLQKEYSEILKFCFDVDFHSDLLKNIRSIDRLSIYESAFKRPFNHVMKKSFSIPSLDADLFYELFMKDYFENKSRAEKLGAVYTGDKDNLDEYSAFLGSENYPDTRNDFEKQYDLPQGLMAVLTSRKSDFIFHYTCSNLEEFLYLEFATMCENFIKIKKCKNCNRYFVLKGNYQTEYCDKKNELGRTCQQIGASEKYKEKTHTNMAWKLYSKYYKRYFARVKVRTIKEDDFKKWQYEATFKRDECVNGNISEVDFEQFLMDSFPNRKPKG